MNSTLKNNMKKHYGWITIALIIFLFDSCGVTRKRKFYPSHSREEYIRKYQDMAIKEMNRSRVPASITMAQALLESDNGNSTLAREANNHFGIKCHGWNGKSVRHDDDKKRECFRKYDDVYESYKDHSDFLMSGKRYDFLFELKPTDYKGWAKGLKKAGYATKRDYAELLIRIIEDYDLHELDKEKKLTTFSDTKEEEKEIGEISINEETEIKKEEKDQTEVVKENEEQQQAVEKKEQKEEVKSLMMPPDKGDPIDTKSGRNIYINNRIKFVIVKEGDNFMKIAEDMEMMHWELYKYNELDRDAMLEEGQILYLQPKRKKAEMGYNFHEVKKEETMYTISQKYGIKIDELYEKNKMKKDDELLSKQKIYLRWDKEE